MTSPTVAQVSGVSGAEGDSAPQKLGDYGTSKVYSRKYSRVYEHYISNNMTASGYTEQASQGLAVGWQLDEGWHIIPYWNPGCAMTAAEVVAIPIQSQAVRVKSLGFSIKHAQMFRTEKNVIAGVTSLSNTFCDNPYAETFADDRHEFDYSLRAKGVSPSVPYAVQIDYPNTDMKNNEVASIAEGTLKRVEWYHQDRVGTATQTTYETRLLQQAAEGPWAAASTLNHGSRMKHSVQDLSNYGYTWHNKNNGWHPHALPQGSYFGTSGATGSEDMPFIWPNSRATMLAGTTPNLGATQFTRGVNVANAKYAHWQKIDPVTGLEHSTNNQPVDHYVKLQRLHDQEGPMTLWAKVLIEYTCELEFQPRSDLFAHPQFSLTPGTAGTFEAFYANNYALSGRLRDYEPYGIPAFSATQPTTAGVARYDIYQDASVGPVASTSKRSNDEGNEGVPAKRQYTPIE